MRTSRFAVLLIPALLAAGPLGAADILVTTTDDVVAPDGECSLREAIDSANAPPTETDCEKGTFGLDRILLPPGVYRLDLDGIGDDDNGEGDLDVLDSLLVQGSGMDNTAIVNGYGDPGTRGDGDRIFDIDPENKTVDVDFAIRDVSLLNGDVFCESDAAEGGTGGTCRPGAAAIDQNGTGDVFVERVRIANNQVTCFGFECGSEAEGLGGPTQDASAAIRVAGPGDLTVRFSEISDNSAWCEGVRCTAGISAIGMNDAVNNEGLEGPQQPPAGDLTLIGTDILRNTTACRSFNCTSLENVSVLGNARVRIQGGEFSDNVVACESLEDEGNGGCSSRPNAEMDDNVGDVTIQNYAFRRNVNFCNGPSCSSDETLELNGPGSQDPSTAVYENVIFEENIHRCIGVEGQEGGKSAGGNCDEIVDNRMRTTRMTNVSFVRNSSRCFGSDCDTDEILELNNTNQGLFRDVSFIGNENVCNGFSCDVDEIWEANGSFDEGGGGGDSTALYERVILSDNLLRCIGDDCDVDEIHESNINENTFREVQFLDNLVSCEGVDCDTDSIWDLSSSDTDTLETVKLSRNRLQMLGGNGATDVAILEFDSDQMDAEVLTVSFNQVRCVGDCGRVSVVLFQGPTNEGGGPNDGVLTEVEIGFNEVQCSSCDPSMVNVVHNAHNTVQMSECVVSHNKTNGAGGGIANFTALLLDDCVVNENTAAGGGGLFNAPSGQMILNATEVRLNEASINGGGVLNLGNLTIGPGTDISDNVPNDCVDLGGGTGCSE